MSKIQILILLAFEFIFYTYIETVVKVFLVFNNR